LNAKEIGQAGAVDQNIQQMFALRTEPFTPRLAHYISLILNPSLEWPGSLLRGVK
jgi:hypothetical protein